MSSQLTEINISRFAGLKIIPALMFCAFLLVFLWSLNGAGISLRELITGIPNMGVIASEMVPPATDRVWPMFKSLVTTVQMALVGTVIGVVLSIPFAIFAARNTTPSIVVYSAARGLISLFRTVPDIAWALFFVASVGLGPFAGTLALVVDTIGFCGRFFAESLEETDPGPNQALQTLGAKPLDRIICCQIPMALPGMINASLFALEKAVRSSVILGLVGAGGIGVELAVSMEMFRYDQAMTIILMIFVLVVSVEQLSAFARKSILDSGK